MKKEERRRKYRLVLQGIKLQDWRGFKEKKKVLILLRKILKYRI